VDPSLALEIPLKFHDLQQLDFEEVKKILPLIENKQLSITDFITVIEDFNYSQELELL